MECDNNIHTGVANGGGGHKGAMAPLIGGGGGVSRKGLVYANTHNLPYPIPYNYI